MPRYCFDVRGAGTCVRDEVGLDLRGDDEARLHAGTLLPGAVRHGPPDGQPHAFECCARDEAGTVVYRAEMLFRGTRPSASGVGAASEA